MYKKILVPVDGSAASSQALGEAIDLARHLGARMQLVHVVEPVIMVMPEAVSDAIHQIIEHARNMGEEVLKECEKKAAAAGVEVATDLVESAGSSAGEHILRAAKRVNADLIVCGTHGRRGIRRALMGSDAEYIVRRTTVPVLLVRNQSAAAAQEEAA